MCIRDRDRSGHRVGALSPSPSLFSAHRLDTLDAYSEPPAASIPSANAAQDEHSDTSSHPEVLIFAYLRQGERRRRRLLRLPSLRGEPPLFAYYLKRAPPSRSRFTLRLGITELYSRAKGRSPFPCSFTRKSRTRARPFLCLTVQCKRDDYGVALYL